MFIMGLDLGTTKSAAILLDSKTELPVAFAAEKNNAGTGRQSVSAILTSVTDAVRRLPAKERKQVIRIGITGQMHGVVCWGGKQNPVFENWQSTLAETTRTLDRIRHLKGCGSLCNGYGFSTLAVPSFCDNFQHAGTIMDYLASLLAMTEHPVMESSNAASWGLWDFQAQNWNREAVMRLGIAPKLLPRLVSDSFSVGRLCHKWADIFGMSEGVCIQVPIGDNPAAIIGTGGNLQEDFFLTIGTGAQLAFLPAPGEEELYSVYEKRPFPGGRVLYVKSPLCGGKAVELLAGLVADILNQFSFPVSMPDIYTKIGESSAALPSNPLNVSTHFMGKREHPSLRGTIEQIGMENFSFQELCRAWHAGILNSILDGIPAGVSSLHKRVVLNGNAVRNSPLLLQLIKRRMPEHEIVIPDTQEEAACGAALHALRTIQNKGAIAYGRKA